MEPGIGFALHELAPHGLCRPFQRYATGQESDLAIAQWLKATGARTTRDRPFGKDAVREILSNAATTAVT